MNAYLLSDLVRINGANGLILETGTVPEKIVSLNLLAPRGGFSSFQIVAENADRDALSVKAECGQENICVELFEEWFIETGDSLTPDCLVPLKEDGCLAAKQTLPKNISCLWADIFVPAEAKTGEYPISVILACGGRAKTLTLNLIVSETILPETGLITCDLQGCLQGSISDLGEALLHPPVSSHHVSPGPLP